VAKHRKRKTRGNPTGPSPASTAGTPSVAPAASTAPSAAAAAAPSGSSIEVRARPLLWLTAALVTFWTFGFTTMMGSDLWWHLASGRYITETGSLNFKDPWSFTRYGQPWMSHEWLSDVIYWAWSSWFGMATLVWWKWAVLMAAFGLLFDVLRKLSGSEPAAYLASVLAMAVGAPFFDIRPQLYSVLGFAALLRLALSPSRWRWLLPFGFFLWVNLHGGFFFGLLALTVILAVARVLGEAPRNSLPLWLACLGACLVSPAGPDAYVFPLHYAIHPSSPYLRIGEWKPPWESGGIQSVLYFPALGVFAAAAVFTFAARLHRRRPRLTLTSLALALLTLAMSLKSRRFIPLFGIAQSLVLAPVLATLLERLRAWVFGRLPRWQRPWRLGLPALVLALAVWRLSPYPLSSHAFLYLTSQDNFPVETLNVALANHLSGKVFSFYEWGGYVNLRTDGRLRVFIDGRADTVFDDQIYRRYLRVLNLGKDWETIVEGSGADLFLWPKRHPKQIEGLRALGWRTVYRDHVAELLRRPDLPSPQPLLPSPDSPWRELALGWQASRTKDLPAAEKHFSQALAAMPNLRAACEWLANTQSRQGRLADAEATLDRCQRSFPNPARRSQLLEIFRKRADAVPE
jgi:hypothetical protein